MDGGGVDGELLFGRMTLGQVKEVGVEGGGVCVLEHLEGL